MKNCDVLKNVIKLSKQAILNKLSLKEASFVYWAVEESRETNAPEEVRAVLIGEEILLEIACEIAKLFSHLWQSICLLVFSDVFCEITMEESQVIVILFQKKIENLTILLCKLTVSEL